MKLLFLLVSLIAVFTANCRHSDGEPEERHVDSKLLQQVNGKTLFVASEPEVQYSSDVEVQLNKEEVRQIERKPRGSKCAANAVCTILGGTCVKDASLCTGRLVSDACKGKKSKCCIIEHVSQCVNETTMKDTIKDGNENIISALEIKIQKLEMDLQSMTTNLTRSIKESANQCVDETTLKETVNEGNNNVTRALEIKLNKFETELQIIIRNLTNSFRVPEGFQVYKNRIIRAPNWSSDGKKSYQASLDFCSSLGAIPFIPRDQEDYDFMVQVDTASKRGTGYAIWFPATDIDTEGQLKWADNSDASGSTFFKWYKSQTLSENSDNFDCVSLGFWTEDTLKMVSCSYVHSYPMICESLY